MTRDQRELIRQYRDSEWRTTRLEVLRRMGDFQDARSFHFLTQIVQNPDDLAEQQLAISALGRRKNISARTFLRNYYPHSPDTLKSSLAHALGVVQDLASTDRLMKDWDEAYLKQDWAWLRNILLSLGELKAFSALPKMIDLFQNSKIKLSNELLFAGLFSLGRLSRFPQDLSKAMEHYESRLLEDGLLSQVYQSALTQIQIRSQFKLEDYLNKIFTLPDPHPVLPLELLSFDSEEVELGLSLFSTEKDWKRFLFALRGIASTKREPYLLQIAQTVKDSGNSENYFVFFESLRDMGVDQKLHEKLEKQINPSSLALEVRLKWLEVDGSFEKEALAYLENSNEEMAIRWINGWNDDLNGKLLNSNKGEISKKVELWIQTALAPNVYARLIRACSELGIEVPSILKNFENDFKKAALRSSLLLYLEKYPSSVSASKLAHAIGLLKQDEMESLGQRLLSILEVYASGGHWVKEFETVLKVFYEHFNVEFRVGVVRILAHVKLNEPYLVKQLKHEHEPIVLNSIIALKNFDQSAETSETLIPFLKSPSEVLRGRALDALCSHQNLKAKQAVMEHLKSNLLNEEVVDKIYRCFDLQKKGGEGFVKTIEEILKQNPDHPQWEKLVSLRDRLILDTKTLANVESGNSIGQDALKDIDKKLLEVIPLFAKLDPTVQSALRAAEQPFHQSQDLQNLPVDKAPTVLEYCKALDLILERHLGQKYLFPRLDQRLHDFQTLWHNVGFSEDYPPAEKVLTVLGLKGKITPEGFPLHKAKLMCATFFNGKIMQDRFKVFDGLRAWAVIFLIFARKIPQVQGTPLLPMSTKLDATEMNDKCISIAKRLMTLQDLRNPAAHRQTYTELALVKNVRNEAILLVNTVLELVL
jgi:hypothetical protein